MRVAVIGKTGQLAQCLRDEQPAGAQALYFDRSQIDLADLCWVKYGLVNLGLANLAAAKPDLVINAAAYTAVDKAESEPDAVFAANCDGPAALASFCASHNVPLIHISSDYVFDGLKPEPYGEEDAPAPLSVYGASKLAGENAIRAAAPRSLVLRASWVYSAHGTNFVKTMLKFAGNRDIVRVVDDQRGSPTSAHDLARAIWSAAPAITGWNGDSPLWGTYHFAGDGAVTWAQFADAIFSRTEPHFGRRPAIAGITAAQYGAAARRPQNSVLSCAKFVNAFDAPVRPWRVALTEVIDLLLGRHTDERRHSGGR